MCQLRCSHVICSAVFKFLRLAVVPVLHRAVIAGDAAVDLGFFSAEGADRLLAGKIAMVFTDGIRRRQGIVRQAVVFRDFPHKGRRRLPVRQLFSEESMEHRAGGVECLQLILHIECGENILGVSDRQMAGVCIIRRAVFVCRNDIGIETFVVLCKAIGGRLGRRRLQIVKVSVLLLIVAQALAHMVQHIFRKRLRLRVRQILPEPLCVQPGLIHADKTDC